MLAENAAARAATSSGADGMTRNGSLPDDSISTRLKVSAQDAATALPAPMLPVKATTWVPGLRTRCWPTRAPPVTHCTSPLGRQSKASMNLMVVRAVFSEGLTITALPAPSAAAASQQNSTTGKLNGRMMTAVPKGDFVVKWNWPSTTGPSTLPASWRDISA